jgi:hypothetical protein
MLHLFIEWEAVRNGLGEGYQPAPLSNLPADRLPSLVRIIVRSCM